MLKNRRSRLEPFFEENDLDAILISGLENIRYLCGFSGSDGALLLTRDAAWFFCDSRYTTQAAGEVGEAEIREYSLKYDAIGGLVAERKMRRIGFEAGHLLVSEYNKLSGQLYGCEPVPLDAEFDAIRSCKDSGEIARLGAVAELASVSLQTVLSRIRAGISEADVALDLEIEMRRHGADGRAFDFIVASGVRGALPHGRASNKPLARGELITIDFGAVQNGYFSDETVTVSLGQPDTRAREIHDVVLEAHDRAIAGVRPGITCRELDALARDYIREQGYGDYFGHGLGHGVGLEIHEKPVLSPRGTAVVAEGMVFTIEPGIYIPGFGGVRIEDTVVVTAEGCRLLTQMPKGLIEL